MKLIKLLSEIIQESSRRQLDEYKSIWFEESELFQELADPEFSYEYKEIEPNTWVFQDRYNNNLGIKYNPGSKYIESFYIIKDKKGEDKIIFDVERNQNVLDMTSFQGGSDEHRSDTICKIIRDEIIPNYIINKPSSYLKCHPIDGYRHKIFYKCFEVCKEKYPDLEIKQVGKEIYIINK